MKWPGDTRFESVSDRYAAQIMGMKDRPSTMITDGPANAQPAMLSERRTRRLATRAMVASWMVASSMVVAISPSPAHMGLRARRERGWDIAAVREFSSSLLLS